MAANEQITIKFVPEGDKRLLKAFQGLAEGQKKFNATTKSGQKSLKRYGDTQQRVTKRTGLMGNAFSVIRSKMLLFNFAIGVLGVRAIADFAKQAAKVESMGRAFDTLSGGVNKGSAALGKLRRATNGTMDDFNLFQQANNAMILGVTKNSSEMAEMFDIAQRLGRALGKDTAHSVESLITGIGRQSRLMLDNIGIIVKADEAYEKYAKRLGTTSEKLTDAQKKQAFLEATMESARAKVASLGRENLSSVDSFDRFIAASKNTAIALGDVLLPQITSVLDGIVDLSDELRGVFRLARDGRDDFNLFNTEIETFSAGIDGLSVEELEKQLKDFQSQLKGLPESTKEAVKGVTEVGDLDLSTMSIITPEIDDTNIITLGEYSKSSAELGANLVEVSQGLFALQDPFAIIAEQAEGTTQAFDAMISIDNDVLIEKIRLLKEEIDKLKDSGDGTKETFSQIMEKGIEMGQVVAAQFSAMNAAQTAKLDAEVAALKASDKFKNASSKKQQQMEDDLRKTQSRERTKLAEREKLGKIANATMSTYTAAAKAYEAGPILGPILAAIITGMGFAQVAAIKSTPIPKFATGGMVGGRRHSQGGTMIEAEQGEFVMSRNAVNAVGIEAMNRINAGGGAGSVVVNVSGNVMSQDYVEGELADQLKEAIRRGADIGVS
tara:strand:+ start:209 stop:2206 length:1998 start_codon:yes stop_codon:yes gene_type:complete